MCMNLIYISVLFSLSYFGLGIQQPVHYKKQSGTAGVACHRRERLLHTNGLWFLALVHHKPPEQRGTGSAYSHTALKVQQLLVSVLPTGGT